MSTNPYPRAPQIRPQFLKVPEVAEMLGVKPRTIYEMVAKERIPYRKPPAQASCVLTSRKSSPGRRAANLDEIGSHREAIGSHRVTTYKSRVIVVGNRGPDATALRY